MGLTIRSADLAADRQLIIETLRRHLNPLSDAARFEWLYLANPYGPAVAWIATDEARGETVGMASAFPRRAIRDGKDERCWVLGDFCIHAQYRTLGPAIQLNRACLSGVDRGCVSFCYDFPSDRMMAVYRRLGIHPFGHMTRFAKVLRWGRRLRQTVRASMVRGGLGILGDIVDRLPARRPTAPRGTVLALLDAPCDPSFDDLDRANRTRFRLYLERSAAYLNWRYRMNPLATHEILTVRRGRELGGFAVFSQSDGDGILADLWAREPGAIALLLSETAALLRERGAATLSAPVLSSHPLVPELVRAGFRPRESSPVILYRGADTGQGTPPTAAGWPLSYGDRDS